MKVLSVSVLVFCLFSCNHDEFDSTYAAKIYCDCLRKEKLSGKDFFESRTICDAELAINNRFFRLNYIGLTHGNYMLLLPDKLKDSLAKFNFEFYDYISKNCCKVALMGCDHSDRLQMKMKEIDTAQTKFDFGTIR